MGVLIAGAFVLVGLVLVGIEMTNIAISIVTLLMVFVLQNTQKQGLRRIAPEAGRGCEVEPEARDDVQGVESKSKEEIEDLYLAKGSGAKTLSH